MGSSEARGRARSGAGVRPQVVGSATLSNSAAPRVRLFGQQEECGGSGDFLSAIPVETRWTLLAAFAAFLDLLGSGVVFFTALSYCFEGAVSLLGLALQTFSHIVCSLLLLFHLMVAMLPPREEGEVTASTVPEELLLEVQRRREASWERRMGIVVGVLLLLTGVALPVVAVLKFTHWDAWYPDHAARDNSLARATELLAWWGFAMYLVQAAVRLVAGRRLGDRVVWNSGIISFVSLLFLLVLGVAASYERVDVWRAEPIAALVLAVAVLGEGTRLVCHHRTACELEVDLCDSGRI